MAAHPSGDNPADKEVPTGAWSHDPCGPRSGDPSDKVSDLAVITHCTSREHEDIKERLISGGQVRGPDQRSPRDD